MSVFGDDLDEDEQAQREEFRHLDGVNVKRPRKSGPRLPAGTVPAHSTEGRAGCVPVADGANPSAWQVLGALHVQGKLIDLVLQAAETDSVIPVDALGGLDDGFRAAFGCPPETAVWVDAFILELERTRAAWFGAQRDGVELGSQERLASARAALFRLRQFLGKYPILCPIPPFWLSAPLTALLLQKFSFGRGGGPLGALSAGTIRKLLINPDEFAAYLRDGERARFFAAELALLDPANVVHIRTQSQAPSR